MNLADRQTALPSLMWWGCAESEVVAIGVGEVVRFVWGSEGTVMKSSSKNAFFRQSIETVFCFPPMENNVKNEILFVFFSHFVGSGIYDQRWWYVVISYENMCPSIDVLSDMWRDVVLGLQGTNVTWFSIGGTHIWLGQESLVKLVRSSAQVSWLPCYRVALLEYV